MREKFETSREDLALALAHLEQEVELETEQAARTEEEQKKHLTLLQDPVRWVETRFNVKLWDKQKEILNALADPDINRITVQSCNSAGKSFVASVGTYWATNALGPIFVVTTAPTGRQVKKILWREIHKLERKANPPLPGKLLDLSYKIGPDTEAIGFSTNDSQQNIFQGFHEQRMLVIIDEANGVSQEVYDGILSLVAGGTAKILEIGNPLSATGPFYKSCSNQLPKQKKIRISAWDTPNFTTKGLTRKDFEDGSWADKNAVLENPFPFLITPEWVGAFGQDGMDSVFFRTRIDAMFPTKSEYSLFDQVDIEACQDNDVKPTGPRELVLDVARYGSDLCVLGLREGYSLRVLDAWGKTGLMETADRVVHFIHELGNIDAVKVDVIGLGAGVVDRLRQLVSDGTITTEIIEMNAGARPSATMDDDSDSDDKTVYSARDRFANARAEWYSGLAHLVAQRVVLLPDVERLTQELTEVRWQVAVSSGKMQIESKDSIKKRLGFSTDYADMAAMAFGNPPSDGKPEMPDAVWEAGSCVW